MRRVSTRWLWTVGLGTLLVTASGCFTLDLTLKADGSGSLEYGYPSPGKASTEASEKARFSSTDFTAESVTLAPGKAATVKGTFKDVAKVGNSPVFKGNSASRVRDGNTETLTLVLNNPDSHPDPAPGMIDPKITLHLPGKVLEARPSATATITDQQVVWAMPIKDFYTNKKLELVVKYQIPES